MRRSKGQRGSTMIEFGMTMLFLIPLLLGISSVGLKIGHSIQVTQVTRDVGHMYARWVDFSTTNAQNMVRKIATGLDFSNTGRGVVILTQIRRISQQDCLDGGFPSTSSCPNYDQFVITHRIVIGNASLPGSRFGSPAPGLINSDGSINQINYLTNATVVAASFSSMIPLNQGEMSYVVETFYQSFDLFNASAQVPLYSVAAF